MMSPMLKFHSILAAILLLAASACAQSPFGEVERPRATIGGPFLAHRTIDGGAALFSYPYNKTDATGKGCPPKADGVLLAGDGIQGQWLRVWQVAGTGIKAIPGKGIQPGPLGIGDYITSRLEHASVAQCLNGIDWQIADGRISQCDVSNVAFTALVQSGPGVYLDDFHQWGATNGVILNAETHAHHLYVDACTANGLVVNADNCEIQDLNIGPATCYTRGVLVSANCTSIRGLCGAVATNAIGLEVASGKLSTVIDGTLDLSGGGTGLILRGPHLDVRFRPKWNDAAKPTAVVLDGWTFNSDVEIEASAQSGTLLDLSRSNLDMACPWGNWNNRFRVKGVGGAVRVILPKGKLAPGNTLEIDGVAK